ncbi:FAD/FMN-containing dehydrogenase [Kribbella voronezhensis]|uniref:FAD/FMN-containing dehydrogenase n=1 Tax=Kribbella voronezhensis TaxID=2512212 RepID=A0A4R7THF1_9ACTN|nr:FAD-binding oxidoreductase [Kribbella voronezhensis]TDU91762.1 FAD/FMN-containing dehydrogenase [Kribbella voronezhensis]
MTELIDRLDGELFSPDSPGYDAVRRPVNVAFQGRRPKYVVRCRSVADVVAALAFARATSERLVPRGGGHCFAGRSSTDGIVLDLSGLDGISVAADGTATIGAGVRLGQLYAALHAEGRTIPAGCGPTVGIAGLTLGGGIGLLGRRYGLTCDHLVGAQVVLADGSVVDCDEDHEPELFWGLRGAGGGQFGVVTVLRFATVPEPTATYLVARLPITAPEELVATWQTWAPDAPDDLTVKLVVAAEPGRPLELTLIGASLLAEGPTRSLLREFAEPSALEVRRMPYSLLKEAFDDPRGLPAIRLRSEYFSRSMTPGTVAALLGALDGGDGPRELNLHAMGGAYGRVAEDATAFAHRNERFLLEHVGAVTDPWVDVSWSIAHPEGSGRVYPNFPDPALDDWATAYHGGNYARLQAIKRAYDPDRFFDFPQAI